MTPGPDGTYPQQRYPTAATRRLLALRDPTCRFPGCHHTGRREAHHLIHRHRITLQTDPTGTIPTLG